MPEPVRIEVYADVVCPWCLIGHRRLARAIAEEPPGSISVRWRAFQLNPELPLEGMPRREYYEQKFGSAVTVEQLHGQVTQAGAQEGIAFDFDAADRAVSTRLAHRAIKLAARDGLDAGAAMDTLMTAYLVEGHDVGDAATIADVLERHGLAPDGLVTRLADTDEGDQEVGDDLQLAAALGIHAVPTFVADAHFALAGAHEPELLRKLFAAARREHGEAETGAA